jgi:hypothetical protein
VGVSSRPGRSGSRLGGQLCSISIREYGPVVRTGAAGTDSGGRPKELEGVWLTCLCFSQTVGKSGDDLKYLAKSVVTIMQLLREEMDSHPTTENAKFLQVCEEFTGYGWTLHPFNADWWHLAILRSYPRILH